MAAYAELKEMMGSTMNEIIKMYLESMPELIGSLELQIQDENASQVFEIAHRIKSSSSSIGATGIAETAQNIELVGRQGSTENTLPDLEQLKQQYQAITPFLSNELIP